MPRKSKRSTQTKLAPAATQNWDDLRYFLALAQVGTLSGAARRLGVEVSTVHRRLASLEHSWGLQLFERLPSGHVLTSEGEGLLALASRVEAAMLELDAAVFETELEPVVTLTTTDDLVEFLTQHIATLAAKGKAQIRLLVSEQVLNLARREADIAIRFSAPTQTELVVKPLCTVSWALYAAPSYAAEHGVPKRQAQFPGHAFIGGEGPLARSPGCAWLSERVAPAQLRCVANTVATMSAAARGGLGIAPLPCFVGDPDPRLSRVPVRMTKVEVEALLAYPALLRRSAPVRAVVEQLRALFSAHAPLFAGRTRSA